MVLLAFIFLFFNKKNFENHILFQIVPKNLKNRQKVFLKIVNKNLCYKNLKIVLQPILHECFYQFSGIAVIMFLAQSIFLFLAVFGTI